MRKTTASLITALAVCALASAPAHAQDTIYVSMRGVAYDSLRNVPLAGAFVALSGTRRSAVSDARGRFQFDSVAAGTYTITMQHDVLDSIGLSSRSVRASVDATHRNVTVAVPAFATLWRGLCGGVAPKDSGVVYGIVRDLSGNPKPGAVVGITWKDVSYARRSGFDLKDVGGRATTDSTGRYVSCGVPIDVSMQLAASADSMVTGAVDLAPLTLRIARRDFRLSRDGSAGSPGAVGTVIGTLTGADGAPAAGAIVSTEGGAEVRSSEDGKFVLRDVPAGTRQIEVRAIGASPVTAIVDVMPVDTTSVTLAMSKVQTLEAVRVSAPTFRQVMVRAIEERKKLGLGRVRDSTDFGKLATTAQALDGVGGLRVVRLGPIRFSVLSQRPGCSPPMAIWIDRVRLDTDVLSTLRPEEIATIEVYLSGTTTPPEFISRGTCGAVVVWTKRFLRS